MPSPRQKEPIPQIEEQALTEDELRRLLAAESDDSASGLRNKLLLMLIATSGLRVSEALKLLPRDVIRDGAWLFLRLGWTSAVAPDLRPVSTEAAPLLERWLLLRSDLGIEDRSPVFCTLSEGLAGGFGGGAPRTGEALSREYVYDLCTRLAEQAGIADKPVTPRSLRRTYDATGDAHPAPRPREQEQEEVPEARPEAPEPEEAPPVDDAPAAPDEEPQPEADERSLEIAAALRALPREQREALARALLAD